MTPVTQSAQDPTLLKMPSPVTVYDPNTYAPVFMPEQTIYITAAGGIQDWVTSVPQCLAFESVDDLVVALQALGYAYTSWFEYWPFDDANGPFAGGPREGKVPWIGISPVPPSNSGPPDFKPVWRAEDGAFVINAGKYADFWRSAGSPAKPFVGSGQHQALVADIQMRMDAARGGQPNLGRANWQASNQAQISNARQRG